MTRMTPALPHGGYPDAESRAVALALGDARILPGDAFREPWGQERLARFKDVVVISRGAKWVTVLPAWAVGRDPKAPATPTPTRVAIRTDRSGEFLLAKCGRPYERAA